MLRKIRSSKAYKIVIIALAIIIILALIYLLISEPTIAAVGDSVQYWAAAKLLIEDRNPYSPELVLDLRHQAGNFSEFSDGSISMMLYPPWAFPLLLPFGILDYAIFRFIWLLVNIILIFVSTRFIWDFYGGSYKLIWLGYLVAFIFEPTILVLGIGHITTVHLLGIIGFLYFIHPDKKNNLSDLAAGACISLVTVKPQLLVILLLGVLLWVVHQKRYLILFGGAIALLISSLLPLLISQSIFHDYWTAISNYPLGAWATPTIGGVLRLFLGYEREWLQILPTLVGIIWVIQYWWKRRDIWIWKEEAPILILASIVTSSYIWTYDMVLLLLPILQIIILSINSSQRRLTYLLLISYFSVSLFVMITHIFVNDFWFFWVPAFVTLWYLIGRHQISRGHQSVVIDLPVVD